MYCTISKIASRVLGSRGEVLGIGGPVHRTCHGWKYCKAKITVNASFSVVVPFFSEPEEALGANEFPFSRDILIFLGQNSSFSSFFFI